MKKNLIKTLLNVFENSDDKLSDGFSAFDKGVSKLKSELREKIQVATLDDVNSELDKFKKKIDLTPLEEAIDQIKTDVQIIDRQLHSELTERLGELKSELSNTEGKSKESVSSLQTEIARLEANLLEVSSRKFPEFPDFLTPIKETEKRIQQQILNSVNSIQKFDDKDLKKEIKDLEETIAKLRTELFNRLNERGGGSMNRQILISSVDPLTKYTDINFKAGANTTITYANNNTTKKVDITITAGGGGAGITRNVSSVAVDTSAGDTADIDYVYLVSGTTTITLPTAVGNDNLYTIKNVGVGVVTVATTSAQTIDGDTTITMPVQYTSVDLISDGANWSIT